VKGALEEALTGVPAGLAWEVERFGAAPLETASSRHAAGAVGAGESTKSRRSSLVVVVL